MPKKILLLGWLTLLSFELFFLIHTISYLHWLGPVQDFWGSISFVEKMLSSGNWLGTDLWIAQNNHRLVLPRLAFLVDYKYFHGSNYFLTGLSCLLLTLEALIFYALFSVKKSEAQNWLIYLPVAAIILLPTIGYNFLNTFNIQWIQCAFFALSACAAYSYGLASGRNIWMYFGILFALLCSFTTFSLTAIWPALLLLCWLHDGNRKKTLTIGMIWFIFSILFVFILPVDRSLGAGSEYRLPPLITIIAASDDAWLTFFTIVKGLLYYLIEYLSLAISEDWQPLSYLTTIFSLVWLAISLFFRPSYIKTWQAKSLVAVMFFVICLGITTGLGRAFMGELSYGIRFYPVMLLYWAAFLLHLLSSSFWADKNNGFMAANVLCLAILISLGFIDAKKTSERLAEEYNRFGRMQMAYLTDNLHPNALYENLVPEWRATSYPGILAAIPYLKNHQWGIFHSDIGKFVLANPSQPEQMLTSCMNFALQEKPRNNDESIRNITFRHHDVNLSDERPYLLIYSHEGLVGAAFQQRYGLFAKKNKRSVWIGMSSQPESGAESYTVIALDQENKPCLVEISSSD